MVMLASIAITLGLVAYQRHVAQRTGSPAIAADSLHYRSDLLVNIGVIAALLLSAWGWPGFDGVFAAAVALYILASVREILRQSLDHLMDRELPEGERAAIRRIVTGHPEVRGMHELRSRRSGTAIFVQLHLELDDELTLLEAHRISDEVEARLQAAFPAAEFIIHADPQSVAAQEPRPELGP
jgi:ferrous-iron efflux pump FieF